MHKKPRSIILHRETLRRLDPLELGKAAAGVQPGDLQHEHDAGDPLRRPVPHLLLRSGQLPLAVSR